MNPFKTPLRPTNYVPPADDASVSNWQVHSDTVYLEDEVYPRRAALSGNAKPAPGGNYGDEIVHRGHAPQYAVGTSDEGRTLLYEPGAVHGYRFLPHDRVFQGDENSVPGTASLNVHHGPVSGSAMDVYQEGHHTVVPSRAVGYAGPVSGFAGADYAQQVAMSTYQQFLGQYSTAAATDAQIAAI